MKPLNHPIPSGDQRIARLFFEALQQADYRVEIASTLRSWEGKGDPLSQQQIRASAEAECRRLITRYQTLPEKERPRCWFTYHLYHKAPDWIGPEVSRVMGIPYVVAEASIANKQRGGPWHQGWEQSMVALRQAAAVLALNPRDEVALRDYLPAERIHSMLPFLAPDPLPKPNRNALAAALGLDPHDTWLVTCAMMRPGDKLSSYQRLATSLQGVSDYPWRLLVIGDGRERAAVEALFSPVRERVVFVGEQPVETMAQWVGCCDLFVWPAVNEAIGMAMLEAMNAGVPVLSGYSPTLFPLAGTGGALIMTTDNSCERFEHELRRLLSDPLLIPRAADKCPELMRRHCSLEKAVATLQEIIGAHYD
ncbi:glycosyltransferase [Aestuariirhabdus litorea]|uniref:Glycosyltransferase n=2 Tax=Aestuariirhabdus litorea TaxID=2528527 RepID=A0A3P3VRY8_9GAMM|nr:glycosyltransferase [Aestuariirhabdus litorea]